MSTIMFDHARRELESLLKSTEDVDKEVANKILSLVSIWEDLSIEEDAETQYIMQALSRLVRLEPLSPLEDTGSDSWDKHGQHVRCPRVLRNEDGTYIDTKGLLIISGDQAEYRDVRVDFPYTPATEVSYEDDDKSEE